jgi:predicted O-methyltransferase YrrM
VRGILAGINANILRKAARNPRRALLRLVLRVRLAQTSVEAERRRILDFLRHRYGPDGDVLLAEYRQSGFHEWFRRQRVALDCFPGPFRHGTTGQFGCEALYLLVRAARPRTIIETGVLYGASSAHMLAALARNGEGELLSIEIGRDPREPQHDYFVPTDLQHRWRLIIGDTRRELPLLLDRCDSIDMFYHDSLHTFEHMTWEFETALPHLGRSGILASGDVLNPPSLTGIFREGAFQAFCKNHGISYTTFRNLGVALLAEPPTAPGSGPPTVELSGGSDLHEENQS